MADRPARQDQGARAGATTVYVVDDDEALRQSICYLINGRGYATTDFPSAEAFLAGYDAKRPGCLLLDLHLPRMSGIELLEWLAARADLRPVIMLTGHGDIPTAVRAMKAGALDFLQKPFHDAELLERIAQSIGLDAAWRSWRSEARVVVERLNSLDPEQRRVYDLLIEGRTTPEIARALNLDRGTVEVRRRSVLRRMKAGSTVELVRLAALASPPAR